MVKTIAAAGVLAIAGSALAAPFTVVSGQFGVGGNLADPGAAFGGAVPASAFNQFGAFWTSANVQAGDAVGSNLMGAHPGAYPNSGIAASGTANALVIDVDAFTGVGDNYYELAWTIPSPANHVNSAPDAFGGNGVWFARVAGTDITIGTIQVAINGTMADELFLDGPGVEIGGQVVFAKTFEVSENVFDVIITDAPAPGAAALLGLAGIAGLRRRRA